MSEKAGDQDRHAWAGPVLFITVFIGLTAFFWWFVQA